MATIDGRQCVFSLKSRYYIQKFFLVGETEMSIKSILVHVDNSSRSRACLDATLSLIDMSDAHVTGIANRMAAYIPAYAAAQIPPEAFTVFDQEQDRMLKVARQEFEEALTTVAKLNRSSWEVGEGELATTISSRARFHDLVILRQEIDDNDAGVYEGVPDEVILTAGRPVLVIPYIDYGDTLGKSILIGWSNTRESARAVKDAMPFLKRADKVSIFSANPKEGEDVPGAELARYLSEHGIKAEVSRTSSNDMDVGDLLLNDVADNGHDMIVMGGYGHRRIRQMILGGVTNHLLKHMTVPVLFSH